MWPAVQRAENGWCCAWVFCLGITVICYFLEEWSNIAWRGIGTEPLTLWSTEQLAFHVTLSITWLHLICPTWSWYAPSTGKKCSVVSRSHVSHGGSYFCKSGASMTLSLSLCAPAIHWIILYVDACTHVPIIRLNVHYMASGNDGLVKAICK